MRVSLHRVATLAGVAPVTVSRVLNTPEKVAPATRAKVRQVMERLGYVPNLVASSLASARSRIVALLVPTLSHPMVEAAIQGLSEALRPIDYHLIIGETGYEAPNSPAFVTAILGRRPEAFVALGPVRDPKARRLLQDSRIPVVQIWDLPEAPPVGAAVGFRNYAAAHAMVEHLIERGYRRIGFVALVGDQRVDQRHAAWRACLAARGLIPPFEHRPRQFDPFYDVTPDFLRLLDAHPDTDALFCDTDTTAHFVLFACLRRGWKVPQRIAVAGFGDFPLSGRMVPSLTSVRVHPRRIGRRAGEIIVSQLRGEPAPMAVEDTGFEIVPREST
jgi:LacI family gluconate utilization system Gnt-I transcriptional repressor